MKPQLKPGCQPATACMRSSDAASFPVGQGATLERRHKGQDIRVIEGVQRVCGAVAALHRMAEINDAHVAAAERWYKDYVLGVEGARNPELSRSGKAPDIHAAMIARLSACERYRGVRQALGFCGETRLQLLLVSELSFSAMAERLMPGDVNGRKKIAAQIVFLLEQLAEHYELLDNAKRATGRAAISAKVPVAI